MKTGSTFNLKKEYKRLLSTILDPHHRGEIKRLFIKGQAISEVPVHSKQSKESEGE